MHSVYVHLIAAQILQKGGCRFALPAWCVVQVTLSAAGRHASMPRKVSRRYDHKSSQVEIQPFHGEFSHHNYSFSAYERASSKSLLFSAAWHIKRSGSVTSFRPVPSHGLQPHGPGVGQGWADLRCPKACRNEDLSTSPARKQRLLSNLPL